MVTYPNTQLYVSFAGSIGTSQYTFELIAYESSPNIDFLYNAANNYLVRGEYGRILGGYRDVFPPEPLADRPTATGKFPCPR